MHLKDLNNGGFVAFKAVAAKLNYNAFELL